MHLYREWTPNYHGERRISYYENPPPYWDQADMNQDGGTISAMPYSSVIFLVKRSSGASHHNY